VQLRDLPRTTSFRLASLFLALFGMASLVLFGFLYWWTTGYLVSGVDDWLNRETAGFVFAAPAEMKARLDAREARDPSGARPFALFDANGHWTAGNSTLPPPTPPFDRHFDFVIERGQEKLPYRALARRLPSGEIFLASQNVEAMDEFRELLVNALTWGGLLVLVLGLTGAVVIGVGAIRRIDAITHAIQRIVNGNLSERLPTLGKADDLDRLVHVVNSMLDDIERLMQEVKGTSDSIAHDLRTPLTRLLAGLERAQRRATTIEQHTVAIDGAITETKGILSTFSAMLRISEVEAGVRRSGFKTVNLTALVADVMEFCEPLAEERGLSLSMEVDGFGSAEMMGDPSLLFEAIGNLVDNAIKFTPSDGRITVRVFRNDETLEITVSDTGPGIAAAEREAVLRRFYRAEKSRHASGSGLGLSLVAAVSRLHGLQLLLEDASPGCRVILRRIRTPSVSTPPGT
jgi:signal transduction histidine kinase